MKATISSLSKTQAAVGQRTLSLSTVMVEGIVWISGYNSISLRNSREYSVDSGCHSHVYGFPHCTSEILYILVRLNLLQAEPLMLSTFV